MKKIMNNKMNNKMKKQIASSLERLGRIKCLIHVTQIPRCYGECHAKSGDFDPWHPNSRPRLGKNTTCFRLILRGFAKSRQ